jgi:hypothetical protein
LKFTNVLISCATFTAIFRGSDEVKSCQLMLRIARLQSFLLRLFAKTRRSLAIAFWGALIGRGGAVITINNKNAFSELILIVELGARSVEVRGREEERNIEWSGWRRLEEEKKAWGSLRTWDIGANLWENFYLRFCHVFD